MASLHYTFHRLRNPQAARGVSPYNALTGRPIEGGSTVLRALSLSKHSAPDVGSNATLPVRPNERPIGSLWVLALTKKHTRLDCRSEPRGDSLLRAPFYTLECRGQLQQRRVPERIHRSLPRSSDLILFSLSETFIISPIDDFAKK